MMFAKPLILFFIFSAISLNCTVVYCDIIAWFKVHFPNRYQSVNITSTSYEQCILTKGVNQGSILGPLLFTVYVNDISLHYKYSSVHTLADDTSLVCPWKTFICLSHD